MVEEEKLRITGKCNISNFCSRVAYHDSVPGVGKTFFCGTSALHWRRGYLVFERNGCALEPILISSYWLPWGIYSEYKVEGLEVKQRLHVNSDTIFCRLDLTGKASNLSLEVTGESFGPSKIFCFEKEGLIVEEMSPEVKPLMTWVLTDPAPREILIASKDNEWDKNEFIWSEDKILYRMIYSRPPENLMLAVSSVTSGSIFKIPSEKVPDLDAELRLKRDWKQYFTEAVPKFSCSDVKVERLFYFVWYVQRAGTLGLGGLLPQVFTTPSKEVYIGSWLLDSSLHATIQKWLNDTSYAYSNLLSNIPRQTAKGCIQDAGKEFGAVNIDGSWDHPVYYHRKGPGGGGPRVFAVAIWDTYQKIGDIRLLQTLYPHLLLHDRWLSESKLSNVDKDLIAAKYWIDIVWDNSKRWGKGAHPKKSRDYKVCDWDFPITPIDVNVDYLRHLRALSDIAKVLGEDEVYRECAERSKKVKEAILRKMWDEKEGFFFDLADEGRKIPVFTPAAFLTLTAAIPSKEQYSKLREHLVDPEKFWLKFPVPVLSAKDPDFSPQDFWMGPTWILINFLIIEGLYQYDKPLADELLYKTIDLMTHTGNPTCWEYYDPSTGQGLGAIDYGWDGLVNELVLRRIMGIQPHPEKVVLCPSLPKGWDYANVSNLTLAGSVLSVGYRRKKKIWSVKMENRGNRKVNILLKGERSIILKPKETHRTQLEPMSS